MTALLAILKLAWPYMLAAFIGGAVAGWTTHAFDSIALNRQKAAAAGFQQKVADQAAVAEKAAREALQQQVNEAHAVDQRNEAIINDLHARADSAESDLQLARSLLNSSLDTVTPSGHRLSEGQNQPGTAPAGGKGSGPSLETEVAAAIGECSRNADRLDSLIAEIKPQVEK